MLPPGFPPVSTVRRWFYLWRDNGLWQSINHYLLMASRKANTAWLNRNRRLAKDFEQTIASATAWLFIASIQLFVRRIAKL